jgi:protein phosphatase
MTEAVTGRNAIDHAALSDVGLRRANNQDSFVVALAGDAADWRQRGHLFMVADGMGAHVAGELASKMACETVSHTYRKLLDQPPEDALRHAVGTANSIIHERGQANAEFQGMGTTASALVLLPGHAIVAQVGDSRVYRLRAGKLEQLTFDHSLVWEMTAAGQMPRGDVANFIPKNIITRSLGPHADVQVDLEGPFPLAVGDRFLVCSDGLSGQLKDTEIGAILTALSPDEAARTLVDMANLRGGPDNITALVVEIRAVAAAASAEVPELVAAPAASSPLRSLLWGGMALALLMALTFAAAGYYGAALGSVLVAAAVVVALLLQGLSRPPQGASIRADGPLGSGPHATFDATPNAESVAILCQMAQQLRDAAKDEHWTLDWSRFNALGEQAQAALAAGNYTKAVRDYALAITFMMYEIRHQGMRKDQRDSSVLDT